MTSTSTIFRLAQISGKHVSIYQPILDATLRDGSRINLTLGTEVTRKGSTFSIRKFSQDPVSPIDLLRFGSVSPEELAYFWTLVENHRSLLISGGTASGKTTFLNAVSMFIRPEDKIVSIEDTPEIHIDHQNWIQSVARSGYGMASGISGVSGISGISSRHSGAGSVTLYDLLVAALRQRPEYVIVGEVRGAEAFTLFQAISVGHASMSTIHAGSIGELIHRVENEPMNIPRVLFQALDTVAFPSQVVVGHNRVRRIAGVTEVLEVDATTNELLTNDVFRWDPATDQFVFLGRSFVLEKIGKASGKDPDTFTLEMRRKEAYLRAMDKLIDQLLQGRRSGHRRLLHRPGRRPQGAGRARQQAVGTMLESAQPVPDERPTAPVERRRPFKASEPVLLPKVPCVLLPAPRGPDSTTPAPTRPWPSGSGRPASTSPPGCTGPSST